MQTGMLVEGVGFTCIIFQHLKAVAYSLVRVGRRKESYERPAWRSAKNISKEVFGFGLGFFCIVMNSDLSNCLA